MKTLLESPGFRAELPGWTLRGVLGAASSALWAVLAGFTSLAEIAGMMAGVACWIAIFAGLTGWLPKTISWLATDFAAALKWAAWLKIAQTLGCWMFGVLASKLQFGNLAQVAMLGTMDMMLGLAALSAVGWLAGLKDPGALAKLDSFGWTALTTVTEGALMALVILVIAAVLWFFWRACAACGVNWKFLRDRFTGPVCG